MELDKLKDGDDTAQRVKSQAPYQTTTVGHRSRLNLYFACLAANLSSFAIANCITWTSSTLPRLLVANDVLLLNADQATWICSLPALGGICGSLVAGPLSNRVGRKWSLTFSVVCIAVNWLILLRVFDIWPVYLARTLAGVGGGITYTVVPMYVAEIAEDDVRGMLGTMFALLTCAGFQLEYLLGPCISYIALILVNLAAPILFLIMFPIFAPESPYFLLQKGRDSDALRSLLWLRKGAPEEDVKRELNHMKVSVEAEMQNAGGFADLFSTAGSRKGLFISMCLIMGQQLSGVNVVFTYTETIFRKTGSSVSPYVSTNVVAAMLVLVAFVTGPVVKRLGLKWPLVISAVGMSIFQGLCALYFQLDRQNMDVSAVSWVPVVSLIGYMVSFSFGFGPLPWAVMAEMFPTSVRANGSALTASMSWLVSFLTIKISYYIGIPFSFTAFALFSCSMVIFTLFVLPNTKGMSLEEIQDIMNNRRRRKR